MKNVNSLTEYMRLKKNNKGRKSYSALSDHGIAFLNPRTLTYLCKVAVLPSVLYHMVANSGTIYHQRQKPAGYNYPRPIVSSQLKKAKKKNIFFIRLFTFLNDLLTKQFGYILDILNVLQLFNLTDLLLTFLDEKTSWRNIERDKVTALHVCQRQTLMFHDHDFHFSYHISIVIQGILLQFEHALRSHYSVSFAVTA